MGQAPIRTVPSVPPWRIRLRRGGVFWRPEAGGRTSFAPYRRECGWIPLLGLLLVAGGCADSGPSPVTLNTVERWLLRYTAPPPKGLPAPRPPRMVYIDAEALAHHAPDWQLADALENLSRPVPPRLLEQALPVPPAPLTPLRVAMTPEAVMPAVTLKAGPNPALVRGEEIRAVDALVADAQQRQTKLAAAEYDIANQHLQQQIAAAQRQRLVELQPAQLSPEDQNRLTNLRLSLLRNLSRTPQERAASEAELDQLLRTWSDELRQQEAAHRARMDEIYNRIPAQMRAAGESQIAAAAATKQADRLLQRETVRDQQEDLIGADLAAAQLAIEAHLPAGLTLSPGGETSWPQEFRNLPPEVTSTARFPYSGAGSVPISTPDSAGESTRIARLRAKARLDADAWARLAALKLGAVWSQNRRYPDETKAALAVLFSSMSTGTHPNTL